MFREYRRPLFFLLTIAALAVFAAGASAQDCSQCDPYSSHCGDECDKCTHQGLDGCDAWTTSTCGAVGSSTHGRCLADNCTPTWSETSRVTQGTYEGDNWDSCAHHSVQWVTLTDGHSCNINSSYYAQNYCDDVIDGNKYGLNPDCCDGYDGSGHLNSLFTCNGYHSCTG
jgi:hypothetical protein